MKRPEVGKWYFRVSFRRDWLRFDPFIRIFDVTLIKLKHEPPEAAVPVHGKDYRGFSFRLRVWTPVQVESWR